MEWVRKIIMNKEGFDVNMPTRWMPIFGRCMEVENDPKNKWYCSNLVCKILRKMNVLHSHECPEHLTPQELSELVKHKGIDVNLSNVRPQSKVK
jgi:hypothetical protein